MAILTRAIQKIFGINAAGDEIAQIGSLRAGSILYTTDPVVLQALSEYLVGLNGIVNVAKFIPALEDINAMYFLLTRQIAYIFQEGVSEYDATTEYRINSIVKDPGTIDLYYSQTDVNIGQLLSNPTYWLPLPMDHANLTNVTANQHHNEAHTLASHTTKNHSELTGVSADQHHAQAHTLASHSSKTHAELTSVTANQHHSQVHSLSGGDHTGDLIYSQLDAIVAVTGAGGTNTISRSNHLHTGADGSGLIVVSSLSPSTTFTTAVDRYWSIGAYTWYNRNMNTYSFGPTNGLLIYPPGQVGDWVQAVHLPHGAIITEIVGSIYDTEAFTHGEFVLIRTDRLSPVGFIIVGAAVTTNAETGGLYNKSSGPLSSTVDNTLYNYYFQLDSSNQSSNLSFMGGYIKYTVSQPLP